MSRDSAPTVSSVLRRFLLPWCPLLLAPGLLLVPDLIQGRVLFWGTPMLQFVPWREFALNSVRSGVIPLWNPYLGAGAPLIANYQSALFYPPNWLLFLTGVAWGHGLLVFLHLVLAGMGAAMLARQLGLSDFAATISGLAYSMSGYLVARSGFFSINAVAAWTPWVIWSLERILVSPEIGRVMLQRSLVTSAVLTAQWLGGHAQMAWYTLVLAGIWWLVRGLSASKEVGLARRSAWLAGSLLLAFSLAAMQLLPTAEYLLNSQRAGTVDPELALTYSFWPWRSLELLFPGLFGHPAHGDFWGYANFWEDAIHVGVLPFLLALLGAQAAWGEGARMWRPARLLIGLIVFGVLLSLGANTPVYVFLFHRVPTFSLFQAPTRWNLITVFALAMLAGIGAQRWRPVEGRALYWIRLGTAGAAAMTAAALLSANALAEVQPTFIRAFSRSGLILLMVGALALTLRHPKPAWWNLAAVALAVGELVSANSGALPFTEPSLYGDPSRLAVNITDDARLYMPAELEHRLKFDDFFRFDRFDGVDDWKLVRGAGLPNTSLLEGIPSANNFDPLLPARYQTWMEILEEVPASKRDALLSLMGVGWLAAGEETGSVQFTPLSTPRRVAFYRKAQSVAGGEAALERLLNPAVDPSVELLVESLRVPAVEGEGGEILSISDVSANEVVVDIEAKGTGWLFLGDAHYPGWKAELDGRSVDIHRAQYLFRAVQVPDGRHTIRFVYRPLSFVVGSILGVVGLVGFLIALAWLKWTS